MAPAESGRVHLLFAAYVLGVAGTLWDWREHYVGINNQAAHLVIDAGGLLAVGVLAFSGWTRIGRSTLLALYVLLALVALVTLGPFVLMVAARRSQLMAFFMGFAMTRGALVLELPIVLLAGWAAWRWLRLAPVNPWRLGAALGVVVAAVGGVWDLYWHQTQPMEMGASMNMLTLPPHQLILAGFVLGLLGSAAGALTTFPARSASRPS